MSSLEEKFLKLDAENAPGQEARQKVDDLKLPSNLPFEDTTYTPIDFSHGNLEAFEPVSAALDAFIEGFHIGSKRAYTEYRGDPAIREDVAKKLAKFANTTIDSENELIITPGTQGALFLAVGATVAKGDKVAIVEPDYFAYRKLVDFFEGEKVPVEMNYLDAEGKTGLDFEQLENAFKSGVKVFIFSNPNNPVGVVYSRDEINQIATLAEKYGVTVIVDELYSRQLFDGNEYTHLSAVSNLHPDNMLTIIGPSKTESLSGFRVGVAFGSSKIIDRMEKLQAIVSLRAAGFSQSVLKAWFSEPEGWMEQRIKDHQKIRDVIIKKFRDNGFKVRTTEAGSYVFPTLPKLNISLHDFVKVLRLKASVVVTPGTEFGPQFTNSFRINFSQDYEEILKAVDRIIQVAEVYRVDQKVAANKVK